MICLEVTEAVLQEAVDKHCNLVIAHHPLIFQPIKRLNGKSYVEKCLVYAVKKDIAIYAKHTNLDNVAQGVNAQIAQTLELSDLSILLPRPSVLSKLTTFVPPSALEEVLQEIPEIDFIESKSRSGISIITVNFQEKYKQQSSR